MLQAPELRDTRHALRYLGSAMLTPVDTAPRDFAGLFDASTIAAEFEKLADLHKKGILTDSEYESKKGKLLSRL